MPKIDVRPIFMWYAKINSKWIIELDERSKTIKCLGKKQRSLSDFGVGKFTNAESLGIGDTPILGVNKAFLGITSKAQGRGKNAHASVFINKDTFPGTRE